MSIDYSSNGNDSDMYVIRINSDWSKDNSFGVNLGRDIHGDGNNDYGVVLNNIISRNVYDSGYSLTVDRTAKIYGTGRVIGICM